MYKITVDLPNLPQGALVEVDGVGLFKNGESTDLPEDFNEDAFIAHHAPNNLMQDPATLEATWGEDAPEFNLLSAFDLTPGVTIEEYDSPSSPVEEVVPDPIVVGGFSPTDNKEKLVGDSLKGDDQT